MSKRKTFPVYVAEVGSKGCGHQHPTQERAERCATNTLNSRALRDNPHVSVSIREHNGQKVRHLPFTVKDERPRLGVRVALVH